MTSSGLEYATLRLIAKCLNQLLHCVHPYNLSNYSTACTRTILDLSHRHFKLQEERAVIISISEEGNKASIRNYKSVASLIAFLRYLNL
jgi:hypothetical protein